MNACFISILVEKVIQFTFSRSEQKQKWHLLPSQTCTSHQFSSLNQPQATFDAPAITFKPASVASLGTVWVRLGVTLITVLARFRLMGNYLGVGSVQFTHLCSLFWYFNLGQASEDRKQLKPNNCDVSLMKILRIPFILHCSNLVSLVLSHRWHSTTFFDIKKRLVQLKICISMITNTKETDIGNSYRVLLFRDLWEGFKGTEMSLAGVLFLLTPLSAYMSKSKR